MSHQKNIFLKIRTIAILFICCSLGTPVGAQLQNQLKWEDLPPMPGRTGYFGMYAGVSNSYLLCLGGANFSNGLATDEKKRQWSDRIYVLGEESSTWKVAAEKLPRPLAFGVSVTYHDKVILVGGKDGYRHYAEVYQISYYNGRIVIDTLPSLPFPLANMTGAVVGEVLYIAGGNSSPGSLPGNFFLALDLGAPLSGRQWLILDSWPGPPRIQAVSTSLQDQFFLFSGVSIEQKAGGLREQTVLKDAYSFLPKFQERQLLGGTWTRLSPMPRGIAMGASPAPIIGSDHILFPGGLNEMKNISDDSGTGLQIDTTLLVYHVESNSWLNFGNLPRGSTRLKVPVTRWNDRWVMPGGLKDGGEVSSSVFAISRNLHFGGVNWATLLVYLGFMLWIGMLFHKKDQTTDNFFTASRKIPWWVAGLSIYGSQLSAITVMAIPAIVYATDWSLAIGSLMIVAIVPLVIKYFIPFFRRSNITSAYEYLEHRFSENVRLLGSVTFILFQMGRMGIVLFLPAIAISSVTGINVYLIISIMGIICILYTVMGGIEAVVWTEMVQVFILMGGAILCLIIAISSVDGGLAGVISKGMDAHKFTWVHWGWKPDSLVLWVCIVGFFFFDIIPYTSDQTVVQRYLTVKDERATAKSLWTNALLIFPTILIYFGLGTVLYVFYHENPSVIPSENVGEILPYFVVQELPIGIAGLVIAGIFAASQSALGSGMNSVSAAFVTDIYPRFRSENSEGDNLRTAEVVTIVVGVFGIASAMIVAALNVQFIFDLFQQILGIVGGTLAGVFILGIFTRRANAVGVIWGIVFGFTSVWLTKTYTDLSVYLYGAISVVTTVFAGYLFSLFSTQKKNLDGLTYLTLKKEADYKMNV